MTRATIRNARRLGVLAIIAVLVLAGIGIGTSLFFARNAESMRDWVDHTYVTIDTARSLFSSIQGAESSSRGYLITRSPDHLGPYNSRLAEITAYQAELTRLVADNPEQLARLAALDRMLKDRIPEWNRTMGLAPSEPVPPQSRDGGINFDLMLSVRNVMIEFIESERALLGRRSSDNDRIEEVSKWVSAAAIGVASLVALLATIFLFRSLRRLQLAEREAAVKANELGLVLESISQGVVLFDPSGQLAVWNRCFVELYDPPADLMKRGTPYRAFTDSETARGLSLLETPAELDVMGALVRHRDAVLFDRKMPNGKTLEFRRTVPIDGGHLVTVTDLSDRVESENRLREAQRMEAIGHLTGGMAHDFNNLLTIIQLNLGAARTRAGDNDALITRIDGAVKGVDRAAALTAQLLAFARRQPLQPEPLNLNRLVKETAGMLRRTLGEDINILSVETAGLWNVLADPAQVENALLNLALNARDAMPRGGNLTIELANTILDQDYARQHTEVEPGAYVMLAVTDTGAGMSPEVMRRVFEPFFTTKQEGKGTGLGLSMVYGFVKQSRGHVKVYSELGHGTSIKIYLPRSMKSSEDKASVVRADVPRGTERILLVEDDPDVRAAVKLALEELGYDVTEAGDAASALAILQGPQPFDLLFSDIILPGGVRGNELAKQAVALRPGILVLFMSGYTENAIVHDGRLDEGVEFISKPYRKDRLAVKLRSVIEKARQEF